MSKALDPGEAVSEAVHVLKGDQRESLLPVPLRLVSRSKCSVKTKSFDHPALLVCLVSSDLQHVVEDRTPGREADGCYVVCAVTIINVLEKGGES